MSDEPQTTEADAIRLERAALAAELADMAAEMRSNAYRRGLMVRRMADLGDSLAGAGFTGTADVMREDLARLDVTGAESPLLEPYRLSLLARHLPLDDWADDQEALARQTIAATAAELDDIAAGVEIPFRLQLLIDSLQRVIERLAVP
jgi:hypothetical protein